jgi:hypothetical protein
MCIHNAYVRSPRDLLIGEQAACIQLRVRRLRCGNPACPRQTFAERLPAWLPVHAQRTIRLTRILQTIGFAGGGEAGALLQAVVGEAQLTTAACATEIHEKDHPRRPR